MDRTEAEWKVYNEWGAIVEESMGCSVRIETSLTETYVWGWMVVLAPVARNELRRSQVFDRFAIESQHGRTYPVGTKGLSQALQQLGILKAHIPTSLSSREFQARYDQLLMYTTDPPPIRDWEDPLDTVIVTVPEIKSGTASVRHVVRDKNCPGGLGSWSFFDDWSTVDRELVGMAKADLLAADPSLAEVTKLQPGFQARRTMQGARWEVEQSMNN